MLEQLCLDDNVGSQSQEQHLQDTTCSSVVVTVLEDSTSVAGMWENDLMMWPYYGSPACGKVNWLNQLQTGSNRLVLGPSPELALGSCWWKGGIGGPA